MTRPTSAPPRAPTPWSTCVPGAASSTGRCPSGSCDPRQPLRPDNAKVFEEFAAGSGTQAVSTTMVFARLLRNLVRDPTVGSLVAPIVSDEARTFGLEPLDRRGEDLRARRPELRPRRRRPAAELRRELVGPGPPGGHHRGRGAGRVHRAGHRVRDVGPAHGARLPLLFHVRLPAGGRPGLGPRRHPGPGHPGRLHGRAHDAHGRGPPARRRAVAPPRLDQPGRDGLRRLLRLRGGGHHRGGRHRDARARRPRTASGTSRSTTRRTRCRRSPRRAKARPSAGASSTVPTASRRPPRSRATSARRCASPARCGASPSRRSASWPSATASPPTPGP